MYKIDKRYYKNFYTLFRELGSYTFFLSALDGLVEGELYADDPNDPTYAIMLTADLYYLAGDISGKDFESEIIDLSQSDVFLENTGLIFSNDKITRVREILGEHTYKFLYRHNYKLNKSDYNAIDRKTVDKEIVKVTPTNIVDFKDYANYEEVYDECMFYWDEYSKASRIKFANLLIKDDVILSYCYVCGESSSENSCELGIETFEEARRMGFAELLCNVTAGELFELGFDLLNWHCHADNIGSYKTALKLGFIKTEESHLAWFKKRLDK